ncbi:hypothetical protein F4778DRAFT_761751, partial [Xylariomycetidae sp. FL2044]
MDMSLDPAILSALPAGCEVLAVGPHGKGQWSKGYKVTIATDGIQKNYFLKVDCLISNICHPSGEPRSNGPGGVRKPEGAPKIHPGQRSRAPGPRPSRIRRVRLFLPVAAMDIMSSTFACGDPPGMTSKWMNMGPSTRNWYIPRSQLKISMIGMRYIACVITSSTRASMLIEPIFATTSNARCKDSLPSTPTESTGFPARLLFTRL